MRNRVITFFAVLLLLVGIALTTARAADDPFNGTWNVNVAKSKYNPGPAPKSSTSTIHIENNTETYVGDTVDASGKTSHASFTSKLDGTDAPVSGIPYADTISLSRKGPRHIVATLKKGGVVMMTVDVVIAADGKSRTLTYIGKNDKGEKVHDVVVSDKQM